MRRMGNKKAPPEERGARAKLGVSYKRRLVLRGGAEAVIAEKVARGEHMGDEFDGKIGTRMEKATAVAGGCARAQPGRALNNGWNEE